MRRPNSPLLLALLASAHAAPHYVTNATVAVATAASDAPLASVELGPGPADLPPSSSGVIAALVIVEDGGNIVVLARSYGGYQWETLPPEPLVFEGCDDGAAPCTVDLPALGSQKARYRLDFRRSDAAPSARVLAARFLMQATFGPTRAAVDALELRGAELAARRLSEGAGDAWLDGALVEWVGAQMGLGPSLLRAYYRERANPRLDTETSTGTVRGPCTVGSRWHRFALTKVDIGKRVVVGMPSGGRHTVTVDGELRSEPTAGGGLAQGTFDICDVDESVGGAVAIEPAARRRLAKGGIDLGPGIECTASMPNPPVEFGDALDGALDVGAWSGATLAPLDHVDGVAILTLDDAAGAPQSCDGDGAAFASHGGQYYL